MIFITFAKISCVALMT